MSSLVTLLVVLGLAVAVAAWRGPAAADPHSDRLRGVARRTRHWRRVGMLLGLGVAAAALRTGSLGRGVMLAAPLFAVCVLTGVVVGELRVTAPSGPTRSASLELRRLRDYLPVRLGAVVTAAGGLLAVVLALTTAAAAPDDLGRAGRSLFRQCTSLSSESGGPWPGSFYSVPLAVTVGAGVLLAAVALHLVVRRPRQAEDPAADDALRRQAAEAVTAAAGLLVAVPFAGISVVAGLQLLGTSCRPVGWTAAAVVLLVLTPLLVALACWCVTVLAAPGARRSGVDAHP